MHESDVTFDFTGENKMIIHNHHAEPWKVTLINTGVDTMTGGRVKRIRSFVGNETFMLTYGDGVSNVNIKDLVDFHFKNKKLVTVTTTQPANRFGTLNLKENQVLSFQEKSQTETVWINAGFFVMQPEIFDYIKDDSTLLEREPLETVAKDDQLMAFKHHGFWQPMDTLREKNLLEDLWSTKKAPWKIWK